MSDIVVLGKITGAYGVQGWVRVHPFADDPAAWARLSEWYLQAPPQLGNSNGENVWQPIRVLQAKVQNGNLTACLEEIFDRTAAESLQGSLVGLPRSKMPETASNEYYWGDLLGLEVLNRENVVLGKVGGLLETGANDVLQVCGADGESRLLPFVSTVILDVDFAARVIRVDWGTDW